MTSQGSTPGTSLVYFSSASENTHRFVQKLGIPAVRIPLHDREGAFEVHDPYVLILPHTAAAPPSQVATRISCPSR